jgi:hypothetical protein
MLRALRWRGKGARQQGGSGGDLAVEMVGCLVTEICDGGEQIDDIGMFELLNYV